MNLRAHARAHPSPQDTEEREHTLYVVEMYLVWRTGDNSRDAKRFDRFRLRDRNAFPVEEFVSHFSPLPLFKRGEISKLKYFQNRDCTG